jgi:hypothetical protein
MCIYTHENNLRNVVNRCAISMCYLGGGANMLCNVNLACDSWLIVIHFFTQSHLNFVKAIFKLPIIDPHRD